MSGDGIHFPVRSGALHSLASMFNSCFVSLCSSFAYFYAARMSESPWLFSTNQGYSFVEE